MLPDGYALRPITTTDGKSPTDADVALALAIVNAADTAVIGRTEETLTSIRSLLDSSDSVAGANQFVIDGAGKAVGLIVFERDVSGAQTFTDLYAGPDHAIDLYGPMVAAAVHSAKATALAPSWKIESAAFAQDDVLRSALESAGFEVVRRFHRMRIDFDTPVAAPPAPAGVQIVSASNDAQRRELHRMYEESFIDHFGHSARTFEDWMSWHDERDDARPDLQWLVLSEGRPVGLCICDDSRVGDGMTYIRSLGIVPSSRGRGMARWLLQTAFAQAAAEGRGGVALAVDSDNTTGAVRLYESVGMRATEVIDLFRLRSDEG